MENDEIDTLLVAANALYFNRSVFMLRLSKMPKELRKDESNLIRKDYSDFVRFRDATLSPGVVYDQIETPFGTGLSIGDYWSRTEELMNSSRDFVRIRIRDVPFSQKEISEIERANGGPFSWVDQLIPLCEWYPGEVLWTLRRIVLSKLEATVSVTDPPTVGSCSEDKPLSGAQLNAQRKRAKLTIEAVWEFYQSERRRPTAADLQALVVELYDLSPNAAKDAWKQSDVPRSEFRNPKKDARVSIEELRRLRITERQKGQPPDIQTT